LRSDSILIFKLPSSNLILISFFVNFLINAATAVAQAAVPHAFVNPAPRSQTLTVILFSSSICAKVTLVLSGNNS
jgi:heme/copper-type cytochrome/quinol oxidase subunit 3